MSRKEFLIFILFLFFFISCKKDDTPPVFTTSISNVETTTTTVSIKGYYEYAMSIDNITILYDNNADMISPDSEGMIVDGNNFNVFINGLKNKTQYYYKLKFLGDNNNYETDLYSFETKDIEKPVVITSEVTSITTNSAMCGGEIVSDGGGNITAKGVCWSIDPEPTIDDNFSNEGVGNDKFNCKIYGLSPNTTYYVRAYATNENATNYGEVVPFVTSNYAVPLIITTHEVSEITATSATSGGDILSDGGGNIIDKGLCWSNNADPTIEDNCIKAGGGSESFVCVMDGLQPNSTYYIRAYAANYMDTVYGELRMFTTENYGQEIESITISVNSNTSFKMMKVVGGEFLMGAQHIDPNGSNYNENAQDCESPVHNVLLDDYYIGETEVTQELWKSVMGNNPSEDIEGGINNPSYDYLVGNKKPVVNISWDDCQEFIQRLNDITGMKFRLPTEAEWEYAAKGGLNTNDYIYSGGNDIDDYAWYIGNSQFPLRYYHNVKTKMPNELGIYDMSGNVLEWCQDWYDANYYVHSPENNPDGPMSGSYKVTRGGSFMLHESICRVTCRLYDNLSNANNNIGMRLVLVP